MPPDKYDLSPAIPHVREIIRAVGLPAAFGHGAYRNAMAEVDRQGLFGPVLVMMARLAGLQGRPGSGLFAPPPGENAAWAQPAAAIVDAGITGDRKRAASAIAGALKTLPHDDLWTMTWHLSCAAADTMRMAGGFGAWETVTSRHWAAYRAIPDPMDGMDVLVEPAGLIIAVIAAGSMPAANEILAGQYAHHPHGLPALVHLWTEVAGHLFRPGQPGILMRLTWDGVPEGFIAEPASDNERVLEIVRDLVAARANSDIPAMTAAAGRIESHGDLIAAAWILACTIGNHLGKNPA